MTENSSEHQGLSEAQRANRERYLVYVMMWSFSIIVHIGLFFLGGVIVEWRAAVHEYDIKIAWSDEALTGFGMMDVAAEIDTAEPEDALNDVNAPEEDENPFEEETINAEPNLDASSILAPPEPEPETPPETATLPAEEKPKPATPQAKLAAAKADVAGMPNLHVLAPGNAKLIVLIRNDRVIGSRFEQSLRKLFKSFPDYRFTLGTSDIDPITDINAMLIATSNPNLYAETFLVVSHKIPVDTIKKAVFDSFPSDIKWETYDGRPIANPDPSDGRFNPRSGIYKRSVYLPDDNTVLFLKPEVLPTLNIPHVDAIVSKRDDDVESPQEAESFLKSLGAISGSDSPSMPTLFMALQGIEDLRLGSRFPEFTPPYAIQASLSTEANPHLNLAATFINAETAQAFSDAWPQILSAASSLGIPGLGALLSGLVLAPEGNQILISGELNGNMISLILMFASTHLSKA